MGQEKEHDAERQKKLNRVHVPGAASLDKIERELARAREQQLERVEEFSVNVNEFVDDMMPCVPEAEIAWMNFLLAAGGAEHALVFPAAIRADKSAGGVRRRGGGSIGSRGRRFTHGGHSIATLVGVKRGAPFCIAARTGAALFALALLVPHDLDPACPGVGDHLCGLVDLRSCAPQHRTATTLAPTHDHKHRGLQSAHAANHHAANACVPQTFLCGTADSPCKTSLAKARWSIVTSGLRNRRFGR